MQSGRNKTSVLSSFMTSGYIKWNANKYHFESTILFGKYEINTVFYLVFLKTSKVKKY